VFLKYCNAEVISALPPTISDGWGGIDQAMGAFYCLVSEFSGHGRPPTNKKPGMKMP